MNNSKIPEKDEVVSLLKEGKTRSDIANIFGVNVRTVCRWLKKLNINIKDDYIEFRLSYNIHVFDAIDSEEKAYWLGFLYADGCVYINDKSREHYVRVCLKDSDIDHLKKLKTFFKDTREDSIKLTKRFLKQTGKTYLSYQYTISSKHLCNQLESLGCTRKKSLTLTFPSESIFSKSNLIYDFIRGYFDGDGCISHTFDEHGTLKPYISALGTREFLEGVQKYFPEFSKLYNHGNVLKIACYSKKASSVANKLYGHATIYLDRKYERFKEYFEYKDGEGNEDGE